MSAHLGLMTAALILIAILVCAVVVVTLNFVTGVIL